MSDIFSAHLAEKPNYNTGKSALTYTWPLPYIEITKNTYDLLAQLRKETTWAEETARNEKDKFTQKLNMRRLRAFKIVFCYLFDTGEKFWIEWATELAEEFDWIAAKIEGVI